MRRRAMLLVVAMVGALVVGSGIALAATITCTNVNPCNGTDDPDTITGNDNRNDIFAAAGNDVVRAQWGGDVVYGDEGNDSVDGYPGQDVIYGGPDGDGSADFALQGAEDGDTVYGGGGRDWIDAAYQDVPIEFPNTEPVDGSYGGAGNDRINAVDGNVDIIDCGKGTRDVAFIDKGIDTTTGCEKVSKE